MSRKEEQEAATEPDRSKQGGVHPPFPFNFKEQEEASLCASSCYLAHLPPSLLARPWSITAHSPTPPS